MKIVYPTIELQQRLKTLKEYGILDTPANLAYNDLALLAAQICNIPFVLVGFFDSERCWFKTEIGIDLQQLPINDSFCQAFINNKFPTGLFIEDASKDPHFSSNPLVVSDPKLRFVSAVPLISPNGSIIGALWILDSLPKKLTQEQRVALQSIANQIVVLLELDKTNREQTRLIHQIAKLSELGEYATSIAHEINSVLTVLMHKVEFLEMKMTSGEVNLNYIKSFCEHADQHLNRIVKIVKSLRLIGRNSQQDPYSDYSLKTIVEDTFELCQKKLSISSIAFDMPTISEMSLECHPSEISQIMIILINNAVEAIEHLDDKWVKLDVVDLGDSINISITDSGPGIPEDIRNKIFERYFTTKDVGKGTGLGLGIAGSLARDHQGSLRIDETCKNTRFVLTLPKRHKKPD